ncbi:phosphohydrolase [Lactobacillus gigeriorum]|uniref:Nudix hydrolase domain-containing protein n=1 Tax=Lactobacillus gigeriorum DSM 23908 = CRBIP 24.85 TaxID=1423751 RepID=I7KQ41_9LACO|nr:phosphohydrolase [Lactobacillus gigeriorum]CCI87724.1 Protein of unknown function [Lactobacillus gigeriorum DSM 23908 = CRBIP 24.85]
MEISEHFGVYGVCIEEGKLLCVRKYGGPYNGRYDLPGGCQKKTKAYLIRFVER